MTTHIVIRADSDCRAGRGAAKPRGNVSRKLTSHVVTKGRAASPQLAEAIRAVALGQGLEGPCRHGDEDGPMLELSGLEGAMRRLCRAAAGRPGAGLLVMDDAAGAAR